MNANERKARLEAYIDGLLYELNAARVKSAADDRTLERHAAVKHPTVGEQVEHIQFAALAANSKRRIANIEAELDRAREDRKRIPALLKQEAEANDAARKWAERREELGRVETNLANVRARLLRMAGPLAELQARLRRAVTDSELAELKPRVEAGAARQAALEREAADLTSRLEELAR